MIEPAVERDGAEILEITAQAGVFDLEEIDCVGELWNDYLNRGAEASGYYFLVYRQEGRLAGFACFGPRALTQGTYDLYWIATHPANRRQGVAQALLLQAENEIRLKGGRLVFVETSGLPKYAGTRRFYLASGYLNEATIRDFYSPGDDLVIFTRHL